MDYARFLLLKAERQLPDKWDDDFGGRTPDEFNYHLALLIEAGLLRGEVCDTGYQQIPKVLVDRLTWEGHDFIDRAKNDGIWQKAKAKIMEVGGTVSLEILKKVLDSVVSQQLGLDN